MAFDAATVWEVRSTGSDSNGGGFTAGATGTDYSNQDAAQQAYTDLAIDGTTNTKITSTAHPFDSTSPGNVINVTGGTGFTVQRVQILSVSGVIATCDKAVGSTSSTGGTGNLGGALATIGTLAGLMVASNKAFVKGSLTTTATNTFSQAVTPIFSAMPSTIEGYSATRGDGGQATLTLSTNTGLTGINLTGRGWLLKNLTVDCNSLGTSTGVGLSQFAVAVNCKAKNFKTAGIAVNNTVAQVVSCEVTGGLSGATGAIVSASVGPVIFDCNIHDNVCPGIVCGAASTYIVLNLIANNTGAASDGISINNNGGGLFLSNTIYGSGRTGINWIAGGLTGLQVIKNNILANNGAYGIDFHSAGWPALSVYDGNAFYANTSGTRNDMDDTGSANAVNAVAPYTNVLDVVITDGSPFTNAAGGDFTLNNTALRGALLRGTATPGALPGVSQVGYMDFGALQTQGGGGGGGGTFNIRAA